MWWRRRTTAEPAEPTDYGSASGRHRLRDNDVVPIAGYRRYADILNDATRELPVIDINHPLRMTPGQEHRSGRRRWLP
jgi:hypothetical protein